MPASKNPASCVSQFLLDPWSTAKVVVPSVAIEVLLRNTVWSKTPLRHLTLYLTLATTCWFSSTLNVNLLETPLIMSVPDVDCKEKLQITRHRSSWINKLEIIGGIATLDLFCEWRKRISHSHGYIDRCLTVAVLAPVAITAAQALYFMPTLDESARKAIKGEVTVEQLWDPKDSKFLCHNRVHVGLDTIKMACLAAAGLNFGRMLTR